MYTIGNKYRGHVIDHIKSKHFHEDNNFDNVDLDEDYEDECVCDEENESMEDDDELERAEERITEFIENKEKVLDDLLNNRTFGFFGLCGSNNISKDSEEVAETPEDYSYNPKYHSNPLIKKYLHLVAKVRFYTTSDSFESFIIAVIFFAGLNVGLQTYTIDAGVFSIIDSIILSIFIMEAGCKVIAEGLYPWNYWVGPEWRWNIFDFAIIIMSFELFKNMIGGNTQMLRLVRLARMGKLIRKIPPLQRIVHGITGGLKSIGYILILMLIIYYIYAIIGFYLFGKSDPFYFSDLGVILFMLYRVATLENWTDILYVNMYGCAEFPNFYQQPNFFTPENKVYWCTNPTRNLVFAPIFFFSFVIIASFILLSLFVGTITMSMNESMEEMKRDAAIKRQNFKKTANEKKMRRMSSKINFSLGRQSAIGHSSPRILIADSVIGDLSFTKISLMKFNVDIVAVTDGEEALKLIQNETFSAAILDLKNISPIDGIEISKRVRADEAGSNRPSLRICGVTRDQSESLKTEAMTYMDEVVYKPFAVGKSSLQNILLPPMSFRSNSSGDEIDSSLKAGEDSPNYSESTNDKSSFKRSSLIPQFLLDKYQEFNYSQKEKNLAQQTKSFTKIADVALGRERRKEAKHPQTVFEYPMYLYGRCGDFCRALVTSNIFSTFMTVVICLAGVNIGVQADPRAYNDPTISESLSILDKFILYVFLGELIFKIVAEKFKPYRFFQDNWNCFDFIIIVGSFLPGAGSFLILLRLLRLLRIFKMIRAFPKLAMLASALINGLISIGYVGLVLILTFYVFAILGVFMFEKSDPWHFETLHMALISLFRSATLDNWYEVAMISMVGCDQNVDVYSFMPQKCTSPQKLPGPTVLFYMIFLVIASQILLVLFIGVISSSLDQVREQVLEEEVIQAELKEIMIERGLNSQQIKAYRRLFVVTDLEGSGRLSEEELNLALGALGLDVSYSETRAILRILDPEGFGLGVAGFVRFVMLTRAYGTIEDIKESISWRYWISKQIKEFSFKKFYEIFCIWTRHQRLERAAIMVQKNWRGKVQRRKFRANIKAMRERVKQEEAMANAIAQVTV